MNRIIPTINITSINIQFSAIERTIISFLIGIKPHIMYKGNKAQPLAQPIDDLMLLIILVQNCNDL